MDFKSQGSMSSHLLMVLKNPGILRQRDAKSFVPVAHFPLLNDVPKSWGLRVVQLSHPSVIAEPFQTSISSHCTALPPPPLLFRSAACLPVVQLAELPIKRRCTLSECHRDMPEQGGWLRIHNVSVSSYFVHLLQFLTTSRWAPSLEGYKSRKETGTWRVMR